MFNFKEISYDLRNSLTIITFNYITMHHGKKSIRILMLLSDLLWYGNVQTVHVLIVNVVL